MAKKLSIIMPAYNAERTIKKSIESVLNNTSAEFELIVVNDGSTDHTEEVIKSFTDNRLVYLSTENKGVSSARNYGLENAIGAYITFIDSDDCYVPCAVDKIIDYTEKYSFDLLGFGYYNETIKNGYVCKTSSNSVSDNLIFNMKDAENYFKYIFESSHILFQTSWNKVFKRDIMMKNNVRFSEGMVCYENLTMIFEYLKHIEKVVFVNDIFYKYNIYSENGLNVIQKRKKLDLTSDVSACYNKFIQLCDKYGYSNEYKNFMNSAFLEDYIYCSRKYFEVSKEYGKKEQIKAFSDYLNDKNFSVFRREYLDGLRFYKIVCDINSHGLKHIAYFLYKKKVVK